MRKAHSACSQASTHRSIIKDQLRAIIGVITHPKQTMQALPDDKIFLLAFLAPAYFSVARAFRPRVHAMLLDLLGGNLQIILVVFILALALIPAGAWLMRQFLKLFNKRLSVRKLMNINGYAHVPRLAVALAGYVVVAANPSMLTAGRLTPGMIVLIILGFSGMIYSIFLYVYGIVVSPSEDRIVASQPLEENR